MSKLENVNCTDVIDAIRLGCRTMQSVFNADDGDIPFFRSRVWPHAYLAFGPGLTEGHVPGRHLNALLNAEDAAGIAVGPEAIAKHQRAALKSFSGAVCLPLDRPRIDGPRCVWDYHNLREGMHALYALARFRDSDQARRVGERAIDDVFTYWQPQRRWNLSRLRDEHGLAITEHPFIVGEARAIGPLVKFYRATGSGKALELAMILKQKVVDEFFLADGDYRHDDFGGHVHSTTCVMSSLAQLAELTRDASLMDRVRSFFDRGLWKLRDELGWVIEDSGAPDEKSDVGEGNNTGDVVETALILGRWGYPQYYEDAERIVRGHLLPSQLRDNRFITDPPNPNGEDGRRDIADRHLGAWGFPAPYGHHPVGVTDFLSFNMDIVGGVVGSLCEVVRHQVHSDAAGHHLNLLFDHDGDGMRVESPYTHDHLRITMRRAGPVHVRLPSWVQRDQLQLDDGAGPTQMSNSHLVLLQPPRGKSLTIGFDLPSRELVLHHRLRDIRVRLRGDEVVAMDNFGAELTYFDAYA